MKYEILYFGGKSEIVDQKTMEEIVEDLEMFERFDVCQIHRIYKSGKLGKTIWTEEEGLFVRI